MILANDGEDAVEKFKVGKEKLLQLSWIWSCRGKAAKRPYEEIQNIRADVKVIFMSGYSPDLLQDRGIFDDAWKCSLNPFTHWIWSGK